MGVYTDSVNNNILYDLLISFMLKNLKYCLRFWPHFRILTRERLLLKDVQSKQTSRSIITDVKTWRRLFNVMAEHIVYLFFAQAAPNLDQTANLHSVILR